MIDGFPAEFLLGKGDSPIRKEMKEAMHFTQSLLTARKAIGFHARAAPPTVTMPRLKVNIGHIYVVASWGYPLCIRFSV